MSLPPLTIIPAGAGSGKTYTIQQTLAKWVQKGQVAPEKIVAVTFTEAAAGELRERIRQQLVNDGRLEDALKLDQAYISTIHSFGLRLLTEFAFDAGLSPAPRLLNEDEETILIRRTLAGTEKADPVMTNLDAYGYRYDFNSGKGGEDIFRDRVLDLIGKLRSIGRLEEDEKLITYAIGRLGELYGPTQSGGVLNTALHKAVRALLKQYPTPQTELYPDNKSFVRDLGSNFQTLKRAETKSAIENDWALWQSLRSLRLSKKGYPLPEEYDELAQKVMDAADALPQHPGPLAQASVHVEALLGAGQDCLKQYADKKREKGLVDYTDMLALGHQILNRPEILSEFRVRTDCLVIDEFQDTNPLQFSLLWALRNAGVPTLIVGDLKQAIMGFQNADSRLLAQLQTQHSKETKPLSGNWRSTPDLMRWVNAVGAGLFGDQYKSLQAKADYPSNLSSLEVIEFPENWRGKAGEIESPGTVRPRCTAARIKNLLEESNQKIFDRHTKKSRPLRAGDIAILCPTNQKLGVYADALREIGIRSRLSQDGWYESSVIQIVCHALAYVADPNDRHAGLYLAVTELGESSLQSALKAMLDGKTLPDAILEALKPVAEGPTDQTISTLVSKVIDALDFYVIISGWPDAEQARANLLRLQGEAEEFMAANREALASGGYYGTGVKSFLSWLGAKAGRDNGQPDPRVIDEDAVVLMTWHKSKGKEWPVVVVAASDAEAKCPLPSLDVAYQDFSDLNTVLGQARIEISPDFVAPETCENFVAPLWEESHDSALRLLYVALTRAREKVILEWPSYLDNGRERKKVSYWEVLTESTGMTLEGNKLKIGKKKFDCRVVKTGRELPPEYDDAEEITETLPVIGRRALKKGTLPTELTPETISPSALHGEDVAAESNFQEITYGSSLDVDLPLGAADRGTLLHRCFEIMDGKRGPGMISRAIGMDLTEEQYSSISTAVSQFDAKLVQEFNPVNIERKSRCCFRTNREASFPGISTFWWNLKRGTGLSIISPTR